jgi:hypothetical protein
VVEDSRETTVKKLPLLLLSVLAMDAFAFRSIDAESYTDPDFVGYQPKKILILVENVSQEARKEAEKRLLKSLKKSGLESLKYFEVLPPTREWLPEERRRRLEASEVDSILLITGGASSATVIPLATQRFSSGSAYAHGNSATYSGSSTSFNIVGAKSQAEFSVLLYSVADERVAWHADVFTKAAGTAFVSEKGNGKGAAVGTIRALKKDGHIPE